METAAKLTKRSVEALPVPPTGRKYYHDTELPGFSLCVTAKGSKVFYRTGRIEGYPRFVKLGAFPAVTVEQARELCGKVNADIANGKNPAADRRAARVEHTLGSLFDWWLQAHAKQHRRTWPEDERRFKQFFSAWRSRRLSSISKSEVQALHAKIGTTNGHTTANRVLGLLSAIYNKADGIGYTGKNPIKGIHKFAEQSRDRFLQPDEVPAFFRALDDEDQLFRDFFLLALLTGARRSNLQSMQWVDVRLDAQVWRIPETKSGVPVVVHLPNKAVEILRRRQREAVDLQSLVANKSKQKREAAQRLADNAKIYVFATHSALGYLQEPKTAWRRIIDRAGLDNIRVHDLRRTLGSWQAIGGASLTIIGKSLGHTSLASTQVYARLSQQPVIESVTKATDAILAAAKPKPKAKPKREAKGQK